jgi:hypothetical protein
MALRRLQETLGEIYDVPLRHSVEDFVLSAEAATVVASDATERGEALCILEDGDEAHVGLYVDAGVLETLDSVSGSAWNTREFSAYCAALEGVSHFVYLAFRAEHEHAVKELELELQAEVDKYATSLLAGGGLLEGNGVAMVRARSEAIRRGLFEDPTFIDAAGTERGDRYREASRVAARYAADLERRFVATGDARGLISELRRYYRLGLGDKLRPL